jgi:hypothetical protein
MYARGSERAELSQILSEAVSVNLSALAASLRGSQL